MKWLIYIKILLFIQFFKSYFFKRQKRKELNNIKYFKCNYDQRKIFPKVINHTAPFVNFKNLKSETFKSFNIYLDTTYIEYQAEEDKNLEKVLPTAVEAMNKAISTIETLLQTIELSGNYIIQGEDITKIGIYKYNEEMFNGKNGMKDLGIDLIIFPNFQELDEGVLASAGAYYLDHITHKPIVGKVNIDIDLNLDKEKSLDYLKSIIIHEFTHILGFSGDFIKAFFPPNSCFTEIDKYNINHTYVNSTKVLEVAKKYYNCTSAKGVELEDQGSEGTIGSHWEASILLEEYMCGVIYTPNQVISEFTLALLEDSTWYKANYYTGGLMRFGKGKGCNFLNLDCVDKSTHETSFKNEFFDNTGKTNFGPSCSSGRLSRTYSYFSVYSSIPEAYQYFENEKIGGSIYTVNYCPIFNFKYPNESYPYYAGDCKIGNGSYYGSYITYYNNVTKKTETEHYNSEFPQDFGEVYSEQSFCALSSLTPKSTDPTNIFIGTLRATCYKMYCSERSLTIQINNDFIVCPRSGGKIKAENYNGYLLCPDYYLICSGKVICNNMFDCVDKKSSLKEESYNYDYEIKTSQDLNDDLNNNEYLQGVELSENGMCPQNCAQCDANKKCITEVAECTTIEHCSICTDPKVCDECYEGYKKESGLCKQNSSSDDNTTTIIIIVVVVVVVLIAVGVTIYCIIRKKKKEKYEKYYKNIEDYNKKIES